MPRVCIGFYSRGAFYGIMPRWHIPQRFSAHPQDTESHSHKVPALTLSQTTNYRLFQLQIVCRGQLQI